jgi:Helix-turn-helix domain
MVALATEPLPSNKWPTPPAIAKRLGIKPDKVLGWIDDGELKAFNVAKNGNGQPRWRVPPDELELFLLTRQNQAPTPRAPRRRASPPGVMQVFSETTGERIRRR